MTDLRSVQISARIPSEDAAFLAGLKLEGAVTPSDKLRAIIGAARRQQEGNTDFASSLQWLRDQMTPALDRIAQQEHVLGQHSELVSLLGASLPSLMAAMFTAPANNAESLRQLEAALAQRSFQLLESILRLGITRRANCYDPGIVQQHLEPVLELAELVSLTKQTHKE